MTSDHQYVTGLLGIYGTTFRFEQPQLVRDHPHPSVSSIPIVFASSTQLFGSPVLSAAWSQKWMHDEFPLWMMRQGTNRVNPICPVGWTWNFDRRACTRGSSSSVVTQQSPPPPSIADAQSLDVPAAPEAPGPPEAPEAPEAPGAPEAPIEAPGAPEAPEAPGAPDIPYVEDAVAKREKEQRDCATRSGYKWSDDLGCVNRAQCFGRGLAWNDSIGCVPDTCQSEHAYLDSKTRVCKDTPGLDEIQTPKTYVRVISDVSPDGGQVQYEAVPLTDIVMLTAVQPMCAFLGAMDQTRNFRSKIGTWWRNESERDRVWNVMVNKGPCESAGGTFDAKTWSCSSATASEPKKANVAVAASVPSVWPEFKRKLFETVLMPVFDRAFSNKALAEWVTSDTSSAILHEFARSVWLAKTYSQPTAEQLKTLNALWDWSVNVEAYRTQQHDASAVRSGGVGVPTCAKHPSPSTCGTSSATCMIPSLHAPYLIYMVPDDPYAAHTGVVVGSVGPDGSVNRFDSVVPIDALPESMPINAFLPVPESDWNAYATTGSKSTPLVAPPSKDALAQLPTCLSPLCPFETQFDIFTNTCVPMSSRGTTRTGGDDGDGDDESTALLTSESSREPITTSLLSSPKSPTSPTPPSPLRPPPPPPPPRQPHASTTFVYDIAPATIRMLRVE